MSIEFSSALRRVDSNDGYQLGALKRLHALELRQMVYEYAIMDESRTFIPEPSYDRHMTQFSRSLNAVLPSICRVSKALYEEATPIFIRNCDWEVFDLDERYSELLPFLLRLPKGIESLQALTFTDFHVAADLDWLLRRRSGDEIENGDPIGFLKHLPGLRKITFYIDFKRAVVEPPSRVERLYNSERLTLNDVDDVAKRWRLMKLFDFERLEHIAFEIPNVYVPGGTHHFVEGLVYWLHDHGRSCERPVLTEIFWIYFRNDMEPKRTLYRHTRIEAGAPSFFDWSSMTRLAEPTRAIDVR